jgi:hypothetical protein
MDRKGPKGYGRYRNDLSCILKSGGFRNRCIHITSRGKEFPFKANSDLVKEVDFWQVFLVKNLPELI